METLLKVVCFLTIQAIILMDTATADPEIDISPSEISLGISSTLDINCAFSLKNYPDLAALISLSLSRANIPGQNFQELAVITQFSPYSVNLVTQEKVSATGHLSQTEQSYLQVTWEYPTDAQGGVYQCTARGVDMLGKAVELTKTSGVTVDEANVNDILEKLKQIEIREKSMESRIQILENTVTSLALAAWGKGVIANELELIGTYQNRKYYVSTAAFRDITESETTCKLFGGTLIEINDDNEHKAIVEFLQNVNSAITHVIIGGTDEVKEGEWLLPSTNQPLPYTAWHSGQPDGSTKDNCLGLYDYSDIPWTMFDTYCHFDSPSDNVRYSCEIPSM